MGRATIAGGGTDGQYQITLKPDNSKIELRISALAELIDTAQTKIDEAQEAYDEVEASEASALSDFNAAIAAYKAGSITFEALVDAEEAWTEAYQAVAKPRATLAQAKLWKTSLQTEKSFLDKVQLPEETVSAWCADLTEDLAGEVGTIELNGVPDAGIIIQPGHADNQIYDCARDGKIVSPYAQSPSGAFLSWALKPGWQKWRPTYRAGVISNIDTGADTCDVTLTGVVSDLQKLNINQETELTGVDIDYMGCNSGAFEDDDYVVVEFTGQDFSQPKVVGFVDNPKPCLFQEFYSFSYDCYPIGVPAQNVYRLITNAWNVDGGGGSPGGSSVFYKQAANMTCNLYSTDLTVKTFEEFPVDKYWTLTFENQATGSPYYRVVITGPLVDPGYIQTQIYMLHQFPTFLGQFSSPIVMTLRISGEVWQSFSLSMNQPIVCNPAGAITTACITQIVGTVYKAGGPVTEC